MLCEPSCSYIENKNRDDLSSNRLINLKMLASNIEIFLCQQCAHEKSVKMRLEEEIDQENFASYADIYYDITLRSENNGISKIHPDFNKKTSKRETSSHKYSFIMTFSEHSNGLASTIL